MPACSTGSTCALKIWRELRRANEGGGFVYVMPFGRAMWALLEARRHDALRCLEEASQTPLTDSNGPAIATSRTLYELERRCNADGALLNPPRARGLG